MNENIIKLDPAVALEKDIQKTKVSYSGSECVISSDNDIEKVVKFKMKATNTKIFDFFVDRATFLNEAVQMYLSKGLESPKDRLESVEALESVKKNLSKSIIFEDDKDYELTEIPSEVIFMIFLIVLADISKHASNYQNSMETIQSFLPETLLAMKDPQ